ncbi:hypothetical protein PR202_gb14870 [Eleusine coracana subsp. coracana]|uniref:(+)-neomenthol dehydrogenase n=1 Tax=Eleusine coracana subsp. coracana TaxID=191504 RepID=A0AAV5EWQ8_ELECO|nr:hypothetical protein PR202_gb14870 [Eleusine coracana subsp. coracana]
MGDKWRRSVVDNERHDGALSEGHRSDRSDALLAHIQREDVREGEKRMLSLLGVLLTRIRRQKCAFNGGGGRSLAALDRSHVSMTRELQEEVQRIAVVTGGNKGIGLEVCKQLGYNGLKVILTARDEERGSAAVEMLHESGLPGVQFHRLDVSDSSSAARLAEFIKEKFGRLDILLRGKSPMERLHWLLQHSNESYEEAEECLKINYFGTKYVTEALLTLLQSSSYGRLINVSSNYGLLRYFSGENLKQELNDIDNLTVEKLDEMSELFLNDYRNGQLKSHGWPADSDVHPGYCKTDINFDTGEYTAEEGASSIVTVAFLPKEGPTGAFFYRNENVSFV